MGKYLDQLQKQVEESGGNRKVSNQQFMNVLTEVLEESVQMMDEALKKMEPTVKRLEDYNNRSPKKRWWKRKKSA